MHASRLLRSVLLTLALFITVTNTSLAASTSSDMETVGQIGTTATGLPVTTRYYNGRWWNRLSSDLKTGFIAGMQEGVSAQAAALFGSSNMRELVTYKESFFADSFSPPELANIIDAIYADASNLRIPIVEALKMAVRKTEGLSPKEERDRLSLSRGLYAK